MKKVLLIFFCLILFGLPVFAEYKPIPKELSKQYKNEIEQVITNEFHVRYNNIKNFDKQIAIAEPDIRYTLIDMGLQSEVFNFFMPLINITDKYVNIKKDLPITDFWVTIYEALIPYFKDNNINTKLVDKLLRFSEQKERTLKKDF